MQRHPIPSVLALAVCCLLAAASPALAGIHYTAQSRTSGDAGSATSEVEAWVDGSSAKVLYRESGQPMMEKGTYLLTRDGGETLYLVNPEEKSYTRIDLAVLFQTLGALGEATGGMMKLELADPEVEKLSEEPGGEILGYDTTHSRYRTAYTTRIKVMGMKRESRSETVQEIWTTDELEDAGLGLFLRKEAIVTGDPGFDRVIANEMSKLRGFPLRSVATTTTTGGKRGRESTSKVETTVTSLEETSVPGSTFEIPQGYTEQKLTEEDGADNPLSGLFGDGR